MRCEVSHQNFSVSFPSVLLSTVRCQQKIVARLKIKFGFVRRIFWRKFKIKIAHILTAANLWKESICLGRDSRFIGYTSLLIAVFFNIAVFLTRYNWFSRFEKRVQIHPQVFCKSGVGTVYEGTVLVFFATGNFLTENYVFFPNTNPPWGLQASFISRKKM
jgi:hypothetical protein